LQMHEMPKLQHLCCCCCYAYLQQNLSSTAMHLNQNNSILRYAVVTTHVPEARTTCSTCSEIGSKKHMCSDTATLENVCTRQGSRIELPQVLPQENTATSTVLLQQFLLPAPSALPSWHFIQRHTRN
jgi:hypothetical protein